MDACTQYSVLRHIPEITHQTCKNLADAASENDYASDDAIQGIRQRLESELVVELLHQVFTDKGYPEEMWFDRDGTFQSTVMVSMCQEFGIYAKFVPPGHHSSYGALERKNAVVKHTMERTFQETGVTTVDAIISQTNRVVNCSYTGGDGSTPYERL